MLTFTQAIEVVRREAGVPSPMHSGIRPIVGSNLDADVPRHIAAHTGDHLIDAALDNTIVAFNIDHPIVDRSYTVPYGAGGSTPIEDPTTFIDDHFPDTLTVGAVTFDPAEPFVVHENLEQFIMELLIRTGFSDEVAYKVGHFCFAEIAEGAWYRAHGINQPKAEAAEKVYLDKIQHEDATLWPPNLYTKPYPHDDVAMAREEPTVEPHPTPEEIAAARAALEPVLLGFVKIEDIQPRTLYVSRKLLNAKDLIAWAKRNGFDTALEPDDMHVTVAYSHAPVLWQALTPQDTILTVPDAQTHGNGTRGLARFGDGDAVVLLFESQELTTRWLEFAAAGTSWDYETYHPHTTISWNAPGIDVDAVQPYDGPLMFGPEIFDEIKSEWSDTITEKGNTTMDTTETRNAAYAYLLKTDPSIAALMAKAYPDLKKLQPGAGDVHVRTSPALLDTDTQPNVGDAKPAKPKSQSFKAALEAMRTAGHEAVVAPPDATQVTNKADTDWAIPFEIVKQDEDQHLVFGWASVSTVNGQLVVDKQDDMILPEDLEKAAYEFVLYSRSHGDMHERHGVGRMVESMMFTKQKQDLLGIDLGMEGWWTGFFVDDGETWRLIKAGSYPEFSIGGRGRRVTVDADGKPV